MSQKIKTSVEIDGSLTASQIANATTDTDKFLVSDGGTVKYRTGAELASDLGIASGSTSKVQHQVKAGVAINKGQAVYVTSADGTNMIVGLASNASEATSSKTMGLLNATVVANGFADVVTEGLLDGLDTSTATVGNPVWLGTGGNLIYGLANKPYAPNHLVFIGIVTRVNANNGEIFVKVQNGFELDEIHDVDLKTTAKINGHLLGYNGSLWVNKTIAEWLGYTPYNASNPAGYISSYTETDTLASVTARGALTNTPIAISSGTLNHVTLADRFNLIGGSNFHITNNAYYDSGFKYKFADLATKLALQADGILSYQTAVTGTVGSAVTFDTKFSVDSSGNLIVPGTLSASGYNKTNWDTAYGWGNHASAGYVPSARTITINGTSYDLSANRSWTVTASETDTLATVTARGALTTSDIFTPNNGGIFFNGNAVYGSGVFGKNAGQDLAFNAGGVVRGRFLSTGFFGIGTETPVVKFNIKGDASTGYPTLGTSKGAVLIAGDTNLYGLYIGNDGSSGNAWVQSMRNDTATAYNIIMQPSGGNVAIGNTTATYKLSVTGNGNTLSINPHSAGVDIHSTGNFAPHYQTNFTWYYGNIGSGAQRASLDSSGNFSATGTISASGTGGFASSTYVSGARNPIWRFGNADAYGLSYFQGTSGQSSLDTIGFHFGTATAAGSQFWMRSDGAFNCAIANTTSTTSSPIFYDYNNTGYYIDPASTSNLNGLTVSSTIAGSVNGASRYFPTNYVGGVQTNPQVYFNYLQGLNVAMTGAWSTWSDTLWINGYSGGDVPNMCALHFLRNGQPRMSISTQTRESTSYGTYYEVLTDYNYSSRSNFSGAVYGTIFYDSNNTGYYIDPNSMSNISGITADNWFRTIGITGLYSQTYANHFYPENNAAWTIGGTNTTYGELRMRANHQGTYKGSYYWDSSGIGLLNEQGGWSVRCSYGTGYGGNLYGTWTASGDLVAYSDERVKENINTIDNALDKVISLRGVTYNRTDTEDKSEKIGVIAQEIQKVLPQVVQEQEDGMLGVSYGNITAVLIEAIKEQQTQIEELKELVNKLINK